MEEKQNELPDVSEFQAYSQEMGEWLTNQIAELGMNPFWAAVIKVVMLSIVVVLVSYFANAIFKRYIVSTLERIMRKTKSKYDDFLVDRKVFHRLSHLAPAIVIYLSIELVFSDFEELAGFLHKVVSVYFVFIFVWSLNSLLNALDDIYNTFDKAHERPIKGYVQVFQILFYFIAFLVGISIVFMVDLTAVFTGLGAMAAIVLLIFKDTILGFVASIQLSANKMVRIGDWISMPSHNADGTVLEITLNTVKIQNWDKTISTVPTYALVTNSFSNWRGMEESGGRRIKRSINIDMKSVKFCDADMIARCKKIAFLKEYIDVKEKELKEYNVLHQVDETVKVNGRRLTNLGVFRIYIEEYLRHHPKIHNEMTFLVRHLQPTEKGLPIEIYVFSNDQAWANYEAIQADIFDHLLAVIPEFDLQVFQFPTEQVRNIPFD
jgi:miniconductance mechanosensitive channel